jgi:hypothetical protein
MIAIQNRKWIYLPFIALFLGTILLYVYDRGLQRINGGLTKEADWSSLSIQRGDVLIHNAHIWNSDSLFFVKGQLVVRDGRIQSMDLHATDQAELRTIDAQGQYLIPGLVDYHVHLFQSPNDLLLYLANGITQVREMSGTDLHLQWKKEIENGRPGPDLFVVSPRLSSFSKWEGWKAQYTQGYNNIYDEKTARTSLIQYKQKGYEGVKIHSRLNKASYQAISTLSDSLNLQMVGHIPQSITLQDLWASNQSDIAHTEELLLVFKQEYEQLQQEIDTGFIRYAQKRALEVAPDLIKEKISVNSNLWLIQSFVHQKFELTNQLGRIELQYANPGITESRKFLRTGPGWLPGVNRYRLPEHLDEYQLKKEKNHWITYAKACESILISLAESGVTLIPATDANLPLAVPGFGFYDELNSLKNAGIPNENLLHWATEVPARRMGSKTGRIAPGYKAHLVLLKENPLEDLRHLRNITLVIKGNQIYDRKTLDKLLELVLEANEDSRSIDIEPFLR